MKLVIDIPDNSMDYIDNYEKGSLFDIVLTNAVKNGTPLPKGHGGLIDEKETIGIIAGGKNGKAYFGTVGKDWEVIDFLKTIPTIIKADEGGEDERKVNIIWALKNKINSYKRKQPKLKHLKLCSSFSMQEVAQTPKDLLSLLLINKMAKAFEGAVMDLPIETEYIEQLDIYKASLDLWVKPKDF